MDATLHIDGGARGNPGPAAGGVVLRDAASDQAIIEAGYFFGTTTNNVAEYSALIRGLELAIEHGATSLQIYSDSQLVVRQIIGAYRVKSADLKPLFMTVQGLLLKIDRWSIDHVPRTANARADELANMAMDAKRDVVLGAGDEPSAASATGGAALPAFTATLMGKAGQCEVGMSAGNAYTFAATTPEGFCVFATAAALGNGPLQWPHSKRTGQTRCARCRAVIRLERIG